MSNKNIKNKSRTITFTIGSILLVSLFFGQCSRSYINPEQGGIEMNFGYDEEGMGDNFQSEEAVTEAAQESQSDSSPSELSKPISPEVDTSPDPVNETLVESSEDVLADENSSVDIAKKQEKIKAQKAREKKLKQQIEQAKAKAEAEAKAEKRSKANSLLQNLGKNKGDGNGNKPGNQGDPSGSKNSKNYDGLGGETKGKGGSLYFANRRKALSKPRHTPKCTKDVSGTVVIQVTIASNGKVIKSQVIVEGEISGKTHFTNTSEKCLTDKAKSSALATTWSKKSGAKNQVGIIVYKFK